MSDARKEAEAQVDQLEVSQKNLVWAIEKDIQAGQVEVKRLIDLYDSSVMSRRRLAEECEDLARAIKALIFIKSKIGG